MAKNPPGQRPPSTYEQSGVSYADMDPFKILAQRAAASTAHNLQRFGFEEVAASRGESAYIWDKGDRFRAKVAEGLGTKNLVADAVRSYTWRTHYDTIAQDTVAMIVNDMITVGALPEVVSAHFSVGDSKWFKDEERAQDLVNGWAQACELAGAVWGPGETPTLKGILQTDAIELSGSAVGSIKPKDRLLLGDRLEPGDLIVYLPSSGIHANGLTLAREVTETLPKGYMTPLGDGTTYGEALLVPTPIYVDAMRRLQEADVDVHYASNITGHGWRKLMRANRELTYRLPFIARPQPIFEFIQQQTGSSDEEMYGNYNMGMGFAFFVNRQQLYLTLDTLQSGGWDARLLGHVEEGPKRVIIEPKGLVFEADSLEIR